MSSPFWTAIEEPPLSWEGESAQRALSAVQVDVATGTLSLHTMLHVLGVGGRGGAV